MPTPSYSIPAVGRSGDQTKAFPAEKAESTAFGSASSLMTSSSSSTSLPVAPVRVYAAPVVASRPFIPCFKVAVSAQKSTLRPLVPPFSTIKPVFIPKIKISIPVGSTSSIGFTQHLDSESSNVTPKDPTFASAKSKQQIDLNPADALARVLPPIPAGMMRPLFSMPKPKRTFEQKNPTSSKALVGPKPMSAPKRPNDESQSSQEATPKRPKSLIRTDVDIEKLAALPNGLAKVNAATLIDWCRKNGVAVKVKDKKEELVRKVIEKINFTQAEP